VPSKPTPPRAGGFWRRLFAVDVGPGGVPVRVPNPPITTPTSPLTQPISVVSAVDMYRTAVVSRDVLLSIPAFRRANTLIAGVTGGLPYHSYKDGVRVPRPFLDQPEKDVGYTRNVTFTKIASDLLFEGQSLFIVDSFYSDGFPRSGRHIPFNEWTQDDKTGVVTVDGEKQDAKAVRLFTSPIEGLTTSAYQTVAQLNRLRSTSAWYTSHPSAREYFTAVDGQEPDDEDLALFLSKWDDARERGVTGFVPSGLELHQVEQMTPEQMALKGAREFEITEVARLTGIDATWLSVNVTTRTYSNIIDERRNFLDFVCAEFIQSIEQRLSLEDTTPQGTYVKASLDAFLRSNTKERYESHAIALSNGFLTVDEVRAYEDRAPLPEEALRATPTGTTQEGPSEQTA
jgi:hypothetical protein